VHTGTIPDMDQDMDVLYCSEQVLCVNHKIRQPIFERMYRAYFLAPKLEDTDAKNELVSALITKIIDSQEGKELPIDYCIPGPKSINILWNAKIDQTADADNDIIVRPARQVIVDA
jgi:hypothetical protein